MYHNIFENKVQSIHQKIIHQTSIDKKDQNHHKKTIEFISFHSRIIHKITKNNATAVQSLNKLSHSKIRANLLGAQILLNIDKTATGSVAEIRDQKSNNTKNGIWNQNAAKIKYITQEMIKVEIIRDITANQLIAFQSFIIDL